MTLRKTIIVALALICLNVNAEDDLDWELDFSIQQKSTKDDFPLQEISQEELSNAAIAGALKTAPADQKVRDARPAHAQESDANDKRKVEELETSEKDKLEKSALTIFAIPEAPPIDFQQQTYKVPDGRDYGHLETHTIERE